MIRRLDVGELEHSSILVDLLRLKRLSCLFHALGIDQSVRSGNFQVALTKNELV